MANSYVFYANKNGRPTGLPGFVGPKGPQGEQGEQGIQGPQGEPGEVNIDDSSITTESTWSSSKTHTEIEAVAEMAGGKTKTYIISDTDNPNFNSQVDRIGAASLVDISGNTIDIDDLNYGDIILVTQTDVPDRWVAGYTGTNRDFYKMETQKIDLTNYLTKANPVATGSFSIGRKDDSTVGTDSVAMGSECVASGNYSVALGNHSEATAAYAFASGWYGKAYNTAAIAGGRECTAKGEYSTAVGTGNTTGTLDENMVAIGRYGVEHNDGEYALAIGNGTGWSDRKDMLKLDWDGNLELTGDITANNITSLVTTINSLTATVNSLTTLTDRSSDLVYIASGTPLNKQMHKIGHTVSIRICTDSMNFSAGQSTRIARVPSDCIPAEGYYYSFGTTSAYNDSCDDRIFQIMITSEGDLYATAIKGMTSTRCNITVTYICV